MTARARIVPGDGDPRHGTRNGYGNYDCRCAACVAANTEFTRAKRARARAARAAGKPLPVEHGTLKGYRDYMCRCDLCRAALKERATAERRAKGIQPARRASDGDRAAAVDVAATEGVVLASQKTGWSPSMVHRWCADAGVVPYHRPPADHGTRARYAAGCRCDDCRRGNREAAYAYRERVGIPACARHGSASTYNNYACRCEPCTAAHVLKMAEQRASRYRRREAGDPAVPHGTFSGYAAWGCRCDRCVEAGRARRIAS